MVPDLCQEGLERTTKELTASAPSAMKNKVVAPADPVPWRFRRAVALFQPQNVQFVRARQPHIFRSPSWLLGYVLDAIVGELPCPPPWKSGGSVRGASSHSFAPHLTEQLIVRHCSTNKRLLGGPACGASSHLISRPKPTKQPKHQFWPKSNLAQIEFTPHSSGTIHPAGHTCFGFGPPPSDPTGPFGLPPFGASYFFQVFLAAHAPPLNSILIRVKVALANVVTECGVT